MENGIREIPKRRCCNKCGCVFEYYMSAVKEEKINDYITHEYIACPHCNTDLPTQYESRGVQIFSKIVKIVVLVSILMLALSFVFILAIKNII